jgi:hypothetical protein
MSVCEAKLHRVLVKRLRDEGGSRDKSSFTQKAFFWLVGTTRAVLWGSILNGCYNMGVLGTAATSCSVFGAKARALDFRGGSVCFCELYLIGLVLCMIML